ncbi:MAG: PepSY domain-containing protein [Burkholderiales bacterium]|nr:PepSY domain-containing protein [Burkholderiales bacterium]
MYLFNFLHQRLAAPMLLIALAMAAAVTPAAAYSQNTSALGAAGTATQAAWLPLAEVYRRLIDQGYPEVLGIERRALGYEAIVLTEAGRTSMRLFVDPRTGRVVGQQAAQRSEALAY